MIIKNLCIGLILFFSLALFGQNQVSGDQENIEILNCGKLKNGLYYSFDEFKNNNPSDTNYWVQVEKMLPVEQRYKHEKEQKTLFFDENGIFTEMDKPVWGFCDGESIFVYHKGMYNQIVTLGRF